jgi:hypothetical protein
MIAVDPLSNSGGDPHRPVASLMQGFRAVLDQNAGLVREPFAYLVDSETPEFSEFGWTIMAFERVDIDGGTWLGAGPVLDWP